MIYTDKIKWDLFIDNYESCLTIRLNEAYEGDILVAKFIKQKS
jgi:hypothetical protein